MRLVTVRDGEATYAGRVEGEEVVRLPQRDVGAVLAEGELARVAALDGPRTALASADLAPVIPSPPAIVCVGQNYRAHASEVGAEPPTHPTLFAKFSGALLGPNDPLVLPNSSSEVDWEVELAFVVGRSGRDLGEREALGAIAGYTVANDVSMRDWQRRTSQFLQGKTFEASTPLGPALVTPDELPNQSAEDLQLSCEVDGEKVQNSTTSELIFGITELVCYLSTILTLRPGMVVLTGTPAGIGAAQKPPRFLRPGQVMRTTVEALGTLVNRCVSQAAG